MLKKGYLQALLTIILLVSVVFPSIKVQAKDSQTAASLVPNPTIPRGTILGTSPSYTWSKVSGATKYQFQVWKGTSKIIDKTVMSSICGPSYCSSTPSTALVYQVYKWRVRAFVGGAWKAWSAYKTFTVSPPSFISNFNGTSMEGWARKGGGTWSLETSSYLYTSGMADKFTSVYKKFGEFTDFEYSAQMLKYGASPVYLAVRMGTDINSTFSEWIPGYIFGYNNAGFVAIWRYNESGGTTSILGGTTSSAVVGNGWNTLRVKAVGNKFWFYINGTLVYTFTDTSIEKRSRGFVGIVTFKSTDTANQDLFVNYAKLDVIETP